ncbi:hypothetical protein [Acinetobacter tandoii]|uniref:Uncharacterized protein n=1 Tax=Acinetobacter tandoii DSM 14970 = CIP 107469 TaxID=1120927 RepID=R9AXC9_9GAMM|nr:hypothetical protein [Acinetobacter tandoii]EOR06847.1 hypothetical protein I593_01714 [Acinetobacter tandoii DSM 14970 = CIP 107469]
MKANEFVKKHGWDAVINAVKSTNAEETATFESTNLDPILSKSGEVIRFNVKVHRIKYEEVKRLVESYELINGLGGYEKAKKAFDELCEHEKDLITCGRVVLTKNELSDALLEYRRANNIFEMDDYIIHDGELKVFAMWSTAIEGCAYIGYAYAEDGEMADKDEFRHATDEEIEAGKRLDSLKEAT